MKPQTLSPDQASKLAASYQETVNATNGLKLTALSRAATVDRFVGDQLAAIIPTLEAAALLQFRVLYSGGWDLRKTSPGVVSLVRKFASPHDSLEFAGAVGEGALPDGPEPSLVEVISSGEKDPEIVTNVPRRTVSKRTVKTPR